MSECYTGLARATMTWRDIPAYRFLEPPSDDLRGYMHLMRHWDDWRDVELTEAA